jgi:hypothetical protein
MKSKDDIPYKVSHIERYAFSVDLMLAGGDSRILIEESTGLNRYGTSISPVLNLPYGSCTANNISNTAFAHVRSVVSQLNNLKDDNKSLKYIKSSIIKNNVECIKTLYDLKDDVELAISPSGTDLEYLGLKLASSFSKSGVHNILMAPDEIGSGSLYAAKGLYFSNTTPNGDNVEIGQPIKGLYSVNNTISTIDIRSGCKIIEQEVVYGSSRKEINIALSRNQVPLLHIVHGTKSGLVSLSMDLLKCLVAEYGSKLKIIIDACQGRIGTYEIHQYLQLSSLIMITGSKFFSGPPYSAAMIIPKKFYTNSLKQGVDNIGLEGFFSDFDLPEAFINSENYTSVNKINLGTHLRWTAACVEIKSYLHVPPERAEYITKCLERAVVNSICHFPFIELINTVKGMGALSRSGTFKHRTIFTIALKGNKNGRYLTLKQSQQVQSNIANVGLIPIQLGQPVPIWNDKYDEFIGNLRLAISAHLISELAILTKQELKNRINDDVFYIFNRLTEEITIMNKGQ